MSFRPSIVAVCVGAAALFGASPAFAQPGPPPPPPDQPGPGGPYAAPPPPAAETGGPERSGWFAGFGLAVGGMGFEDQEEGSGGARLSGHFGGMVSPRFGVALDLTLAAYAPSDPELEFLCGYRCEATWGVITIGVAAQLWATDKLWLRGSLGSTRVSLTVDDQEVSDGEGATFGGTLGYEIVQRPSFAMDISFGFTMTGLDPAPQFGGDSMATGQLGVGFTWY